MLGKRGPDEEKKNGDMRIADTAKEKPFKDGGMADGNGTKDEDVIVKPGDNIL